MALSHTAVKLKVYRKNEDLREELSVFFTSIRQILSFVSKRAVCDTSKVGVFETRKIRQIIYNEFLQQNLD